MAYETDRFSDYVDVAERIRIFRDRHPEGSLQPLDPEHPFQVLEVGGQIFVAYTAVAYRHPDDPRPGIAVSWEPFPGKTPYTAGSELMNAETAAWGRAIVAALAADTKKVASLDEVRARRASQGQPRISEEQALEMGRANVEALRSASQTRQDAPRGEQSDDMGRGAPATEAQERALYAISKKLGRTAPPKGSYTKSQAGAAIEKLQAELDAKTAAAGDQEEPF